jgi:hypothetical protein
MSTSIFAKRKALNNGVNIPNLIEWREAYILGLKKMFDDLAGKESSISSRSSFVGFVTEHGKNTLLMIPAYRNKSVASVYRPWAYHQLERKGSFIYPLAYVFGCEDGESKIAGVFDATVRGVLPEIAEPYQKKVENFHEAAVQVIRERKPLLDIIRDFDPIDAYTLVTADDADTSSIRLATTIATIRQSIAVMGAVIDAKNFLIEDVKIDFSEVEEEYYSQPRNISIDRFAGSIVIGKKVNSAEEAASTGDVAFEIFQILFGKLMQLAPTLIQ